MVNVRTDDSLALIARAAEIFRYYVKEDVISRWPRPRPNWYEVRYVGTLANRMDGRIGQVRIALFIGDDFVRGKVDFSRFINAFWWSRRVDLDCANGIEVCDLVSIENIADDVNLMRKGLMPDKWIGARYRKEKKIFKEGIRLPSRV